VSRSYWCRLCKNVLEHPGGNLPTECPHCEQGAHWSAEAVPQKDYVLTENDVRFLRSLKIAATNDHEADGA
jgi:hypothetical protein